MPCNLSTAFSRWRHTEAHRRRNKRTAQRTVLDFGSTGTIDHVLSVSSVTCGKVCPDERCVCILERTRLKVVFIGVCDSPKKYTSSSCPLATLPLSQCWCTICAVTAPCRGVYIFSKCRNPHAPITNILFSRRRSHHALNTKVLFSMCRSHHALITKVLLSRRRSCTLLVLTASRSARRHRRRHCPRTTRQSRWRRSRNFRSP